MSDMTGPELRRTLTALGMTQGSFARLIEVSDDTVSRWHTGQRAIPKVVALYLRLLLALQRGEPK